MSAAKVVKSDATASTHQASVILRNIEQDEAWAYFKPPPNHEDLVKSSNTLQQAVDTHPFLRRAMSTSNLAELKSEFKPAELVAELTRMRDVMSPMVSSLNRECELLMQTFAARSKVK